MATRGKSLGVLAVGSAVFIRTVTHYYVGRVKSVGGVGGVAFVCLEDAAWVADTGRFSDALKSGVLNEVEPFNAPVWIGLGSIVDVTAWTGEIPLAKK